MKAKSGSLTVQEAPPSADRPYAVAKESSKQAVYSPRAKGLEGSTEDAWPAASQLQLAEHTVRESLAMEIHDGAAQTLFAAMRYLQLYRRQVDESEAAPYQTLAKAESLLKKAWRQIRELTSPVTLDSSGQRSLLAAVREQASLLVGQGCRVKLQLLQVFLPPETEEVLLGIISEALHNIMKHAHARRALVRLSLQDGHLKLHIRDWGRGFNPKARSSSPWGGSGLGNMRRRAQALGGAFALSSRPGRGTSIRVTIPANAR